LIDADLRAHADADLIVGADGINSAIRQARREHFGAKIDLRPNKFA
jgi:2-polyprenyl-6-methoxyphenol hydroxylase-like FAD-dependent oxidoreductase